MLRADLDKIPDFVIDGASSTPIANRATTADSLAMPATFTRGKRLGDAELPGFGHRLAW
jgi:hypothetical protein